MSERLGQFRESDSIRESDQLRDYLAPDERLTAVYSATFAENSPWTPVSLGVTDRRLLCVSDGGTFVNLDHDSICTIRSRLRSTLRYRGNDHRLLMGLGGLVAVLSFVGVVAFASSLFVPVLLPVVVAGLASAEYHRRATDGIDVSVVADIVRRSRPGEDERSASRDGHRTTGNDPSITEREENRQVVLLGNGLVAVGGFLGIVVLSSSWPVVFLTLVTIGGVALIDYAHRHRAEFDGIEIIRRREREVSIDTDGGGTVRFRCEPSAGIDRELSRLAFVDRADGFRAVSSRSKSAAGAGSEG